MAANVRALRAPEEVMSARRAAAVFPTALSFPRATVRELLGTRFAVEKLRFDLDEQGRGEVLYRLTLGTWSFHFFLISHLLPESQKTDRNFAAGWDAMGVLCEGDWTADREARLRREVPLQRAGFADYDTLIYARGNRSGRIFDHVVASLAAGHQPDLALLAPVGYILRTTAFIGNGQLGTRPLSGFDPDHPLRRPYHAQFCSGFLLREFVFDLVDHLARARSATAVRLAPAYRRYLGLGNSAATGLAAFVGNHPHFMHQWTLVHERVLAAVVAQAPAPSAPQVQAFGAWLDKAVQHFREGDRPADGVFPPVAQLVHDLQQAQAAWASWQASGRLGEVRVERLWAYLRDWAAWHVGPDACEVLDALIIEVHPEIVAQARDDHWVDERCDVQPAMSLGDLRDLLARAYGWALQADAADHHFWYRSTAAPRDVRRGLRGAQPELESETTQDTTRQVRTLWSALQGTDADERVAPFLCRHPQLRYIVARVQTLADRPYAELRMEWLAQDFQPFAAIRYALSFFGMEKIEAALPKSVRGTFLQGAPIAEDVAQGRDGDWPFPVMPQVGATHAGMTLAPLPPAGQGALPRPLPLAGPMPASQVVRLAPGELARMAQTALQGHGASLGVAEAAGRAVALAEALGWPAVSAVLRQCDAARPPATLAHEPVGRLNHLDAADHSLMLALPDATDLALAQAETADSGVGVALVTRARDAWLAVAGAVRMAEHGGMGLAFWAGQVAQGRTCGFAIAGREDAGASRSTWLAYGELAMPPAALMQGWRALGGAGGEAFDQALEGLATTLLLRPEKALCELLSRDPMARPAGEPSPDLALLASVSAARRSVPATRILSALQEAGVSAVRHDAALFGRLQQGWHRYGLPVTRGSFDALAEAGHALLVPRDVEHRILPEGADPLKQF